MFEKAAADKRSRVSDLVYGPTLKKSDDFYEEYVRDHEGYLYSLDKDNKISEGETGKYVFCINKRYFYVEQSSDFVKYREIIGGFYPPEGVGGYVITPVLRKDGLDCDAFAWKGKNRFAWSDTAGVGSFDELVEFYGRVDAQTYSVDAENERIYLSAYDCEGWIPKAAVLEATSTGFDISLLQND